MNILEEIGFTKKEAEIYTRVLSRGEGKITSLQKELGIHPQIVYRTIESLREKGFVSVFQKKGVAHVIAESPKELVRQEKQRLATLQAALPDLLALQHVSEGAFVTTSKGDTALRAFREKAYRVMKKNETLYIIGGSGDRFYIAMGERYGEIEDVRIEKKINKKLISTEAERNKFLAYDTKRECSEFKFLPNNFPIVSSTNIYHNTVGIIIWAEEPIIICITSEQVAESYKSYFRQLWSIAVV